jgi:antitoxin VapB
MALNIKDAETDRLARELASEAGESITVATRRAIEERLARVRARKNAGVAGDGLDEFIRRGRERAVLDTRGIDEILGYDEHGLPR